MQPRSPLTHLLLFVFALLLAPLLARADIALPVWGSSGSNSYSDRCPGGFYLVGINVGMGAWYDQIGLVCAQVQPNLTFTNKQFPRLHGGNGGGAPVDYSCNDDEIVTALVPRYVENENTKDQLGEIAALTLGCKSLKSGAQRNLFVNAAYPAGSILGHYPESTQRCPDNTVAVGLNLRFGRYVNAVGLICDTYVPPPPVVAQAPPPKPIKTTGKAKGSASGPSAPPGLLVCRFGPTMKPFGNVSADSMLLTFDAAPQGANVALPGPGQCAWDVQPISPNQTRRLGLGKSVLAQLTGIEMNTVFKVHATVMSAFLMTTGTVEIIPPEGAEAPAAQAGEPAQGGEAGAPAQGGGGGIGIASADCPAGTATVQTPPGLDVLNVRPGPSTGSKPIAQVPNGSEVTVSGSCIDAAKGAGFAKQTLAPKGQGGGGMAAGGDGPWCRIEAPDQGCVKAEFLVFAGNGGGGEPIDPAKGAGLVAQKPKAAVTGNGFKGDWNANADGVGYRLHLDQIGSVVKGSFTADDGSKGTILGNLNGKTLRFGWVQTNDGQTGSGKFVLSGNGGSFSGTYNFQVGNFDKVEGQWNGQRM